jgi:hypothetical protein
MNGERHDPTDDAIARGLTQRAPHGADPDLLAAIMAGVGSLGQVIRVGPVDVPVIATRRRWVLVLVAGVLALAIVAVAIVGAGSSNRNRFTVVPPPVESPTPPPPSVSPSASLPVSSLLPPVSREPCNGPSTMAVADASRSVTSPMSEFAGLGRQGRLAYLTRSNTADAPIQLWAAIGGSNAINRIATFSGPGIDVARVLDWTPHAEAVLVAIGHTSTEVTHPDASNVEYTIATSCTDLYEVWQDGSALRRITDNASDVDVASARFTPDDSKLAFTTVRRSDSSEPASIQAALDQTRSTDVVYLRAGDVMTAPGACGGADWSSGRWSVVVACVPDDHGHRAGVALLDPETETWNRIDAPAGSSPLLAAWLSGQDHVIAIGSNLESIDTLDTVTQTWTVGSGTNQDPSVHWTFDGPRALSPDRSLMIATASPVKLPSRQVIIDLHTGRPRAQAYPSDRQGATWTLDSTGLVVDDGRSLDVVTIDGVRSTHIGDLPDPPNASTLSYAIEMP